jgi:hypothetical protein
MAESDNFNNAKESSLKDLIYHAQRQNPWFTENNILKALNEWINALEDKNVEDWISRYNLSDQSTTKIVGVVNAGNIPFVGFHDMLSVLMSGHKYAGKNAGDDSYLLPFIAAQLIKAEPRFSDKINFIQKLVTPDAVIATGSNNTSRYFEYYFRRYPHIIRKNRNGIAVLTGNETNDDLNNLGTDIFTYFGLGCRNISKIYIPSDYSFDNFFENIFSYQEIANHNKYINNFEYYNSVLLLKRIPFLQNGFLIVREEKHISSPVAVLHYEKYESLDKLTEELHSSYNYIQCIAADKILFPGHPALWKIRVDFGKTQSPQLWEYADGVDTMEFLTRVD